MTLTGEPTDLVFFAVVVGARLLLPLIIPWFPLPGVLAALILDAVDQTLFQNHTNLDLSGYQGYDKALDIYYLTIAYISTMRNWTSLFAFKLSRLLFYYRLLGVLMFELLGLRPLLLFFPNTFEYFFIYYEVVRLRWSPARRSSTFWLGGAFIIWVFIKVPQEYWIHIVQLDVTDIIAAAAVSALPGSWFYFVVRNWLLLTIVVAIMILIGVWWLLRRLPAAEHRLRISAGKPETLLSDKQMKQAAINWSRRVIDIDLVEKVVLLSLLSIIFAQVLPGVRSTPLQLALVVALFVLVNTALSHYLVRRDADWSLTAWELVILGATNFALALAYTFFVRATGGTVLLANTTFFVVLLTLITTLFDKFQQVYLAQFPRAL